jgi:uncharacterized protein YggE
MERTIKMRGRATVTAPSDITVVSMRVSGKEDKFEDAVRAMTESTVKLKDAVEKAGIKRSSFKTSELSVDLAYRKERIGKDKYGNDKFRDVPDGYSYTQKVSFEFKNDNEKLSKALSNIMDCGVTPRIDFYFKSSDIESMKNKALANACKHAQEEAKTIVESVGAKLGRLLSVDRNFSVYDYDSEECDCRMPVVECRANMALDIDPEDTSVDQSVTMEWEIID